LMRLSPPQLGQAFLHCLHLGLQVGQVGLQLGDLF
jgi:hypothetical protein